MILEFAEYIGIAAFTLSGFYIAVRHNLDLLGIFIVSFLTALGGGIIRDTITGIAPISLTTLYPMLLVFVIVNILILLKFHKKQEYDRKPIFIVADSLGLSSFSISGALIAVNSGYEISGVIIIAFITAVGGGILRDILLNEVPYILKGGFYAMVAIIIGIFIYILHIFNQLNFLYISILFFFGVILRLVAFYNHWELPNIYKKG
jgi:uncharacterized membrane protein YeiH